jgi:deoxyribonuclease-4
LVKTAISQQIQKRWLFIKGNEKFFHPVRKLLSNGVIIFMRLGFHISIAGGFKQVVERAQKRQCETIQLFSRNPRGWKYKPLDEDDIVVFKREVQRERISPVFVHMPYLPNLASADSSLFERSVDSLIEDLKRSEKIDARFLIMHVGSSENEEKGIRRMADGINRAFSRAKNKVILILENTAGSGNELGYTFRQIKEIIDGVDQEKRMGVVFDTAHGFEAGYDMRTEEGVNTTIEECDRFIGLDRLYLIHLNDSKTTLGSRKDRHWHIAKGEIGNGMKYILHHPALQEKPFIMETPRDDLKEDLMNMRMVKKLLHRG